MLAQTAASRAQSHEPSISTPRHANTNEKTALLPDTTPVPRRQRFHEIPHATTTALAALTTDPLERYIHGSRDTQTPLRRAIRWLLASLVEVRGTAQGAAWSVHGGAGIMLGHRAPNGGERCNVWGRAVQACVGCLVGVLERVYGAQQRKRVQLFREKMHEVVVDALGERKDEMLSITALATRPACQGRGYATALVRVVTSLADKQGRAVWLGSSNVANVGFYNSLGFVTVRRFMMGEEDATWDGGPFPIDLMVREPHSLVPSE